MQKCSIFVLTNEEIITVSSWHSWKVSCC